MKTASLTIAALATIGMGAVQAQALTQGVSPGEIVIGTVQDLSGPSAAQGKQSRYGMQLRVDEINGQGGIAGRLLKLLVEDGADDPKRTAVAVQKLVSQDKVFLLVGHVGVPHNGAAMPVPVEKNVISFQPVASMREMHAPGQKLKYSLTPSHFDQMRHAVPKLARDKGARKVCMLYQDDAFGLEALQGAEAGLKTIGIELAAKASGQRGGANFSPQVAQLKSAGCEMVVLGTGSRETIVAVSASRKAGFNPIFLASSASYSDLVHKQGGKPMDGLYAAMTVQYPYLDDASQPMRFWANRYKTKFNEEPTVFSVQGYTAIDLFAKAAQKAGTRLSTDSFVQAMDTLTVEPDMFGAPLTSFTATKRLGNDQARLSQLVDGRWKVVGDQARP